ncbi:hypothetical protein JQC92_06865 [Shewanella sp. 202IG2-18]|uniref:hypothetical protein n=1 Tax=Parashewanella hymeniacidonis TaxID=2807618 RepID=UPI001960FD15|nr:hypothetical protein [Parashewanella hymeniacidonis]MBM7071764.1 hypothetical protein [Parashewanella hymeniacidonis]
MASVYSSSIYPSPYSVLQADSPPELSNVANSICHSTNLERAFTEERFANLTRHAKGVDELKAELLTLHTQDIEMCFRAILQQDYNDPIFKQESAGSLLIYLYATGEIDKNQYTDFAYLTNFYGQFNDHAVKEDEVFDCSIVEVIDLNSLEYQSVKQELLEHESLAEESTGVTGLDYARYFRDHPNKPCFVMRAKFTEKQKDEVSSHNGRVDKLSRKPLYWFNYSCQVKIAPCYYDSKSSTVFFPTFRAQTEISEKDEHKVNFEPFLGTTSADDLASYRKKHSHPLAIYHRKIQNNFSFPHGSFASKFYAAMHDCGHIIILNKIPDKYKDFFLEFDEIIMDYLQLLLNGKTFNFDPYCQKALQILIDKSDGKIQIPIEPTQEQIKQEYELLLGYETKHFRPFLDQAMSKIEKTSKKGFIAVEIYNALHGAKPWLSALTLNYVMYRFSEQSETNFKILKESLLILSERLPEIDTEEKLSNAYWHFVKYWHVTPQPSKEPKPLTKIKS